MHPFYITAENSEDRFDSTDNLEDAIRIAKKVVQQGEVDGPVCIEHCGKNIRQFQRMPDGRVAEEVLA